MGSFEASACDRRRPRRRAEAGASLLCAQLGHLTNHVVSQKGGVALVSASNGQATVGSSRSNLLHEGNKLSNALAEIADVQPVRSGVGAHVLHGCCSELHLVRLRRVLIGPCESDTEASDLSAKVEKPEGR